MFQLHPLPSSSVDSVWVAVSLRPLINPFFQAVKFTQNALVIVAHFLQCLLLLAMGNGVAKV